MYSYREERDRRAKQLARYLRIMFVRTRRTEADCFVIFSNHPHLPKAGGSSALVRHRMAQYLSPDVGKKHGCGRRGRRFVQFAFSQRKFMLDLPNTTITEFEVARLFQDRFGFVRNLEVLDRKKLAFEKLPPEHLDPIDKSYCYGEEMLAAGDAAYILFDLWGMRIDTTLYVRAAAFDWPARWEEDRPIN